MLGAVQHVLGAPKGPPAPPEKLPAANYPNIRLFTVTKKTIHEPTTALRGWWLPCNPKTAATFSAVAYYFGRELHRESERPHRADPQLCRGHGG